MGYRAKYSELKKAINEGKRSQGYYSRNPYGPPPNPTNATWSQWEMDMNRAFIRGMSRIPPEDV